MLASVALAEDAQQAIDLRPRFVAGQQARYSMWTRRNTHTQVTLMGNTREQSTSYVIEGDATWSVLSVNADGSAQCQMTFDWFSLTLTLPDGTIQVNDTRNGTSQNEEVYKVLSAMVGRPVTVEMAADGMAKSVTGTDAMRSVAGAETEIPKDLDFVESACDLATLPMAPAQTTVGQSWDAAFRWSHELGHMNHDISYTLVSLRNVHGIDLATVSGKGRLALEVDASKLPQDNGVQVDIGLDDGSIVNQILIDMDRHEAVGRNTLMTTRIHSTMTNGENTISQLTTETVQSQALRISETDPVQ